MSLPHVLSQHLVTRTKNFYPAPAPHQVQRAPTPYPHAFFLRVTAPAPQMQVPATRPQRTQPCKKYTKP